MKKKGKFFLCFLTVLFIGILLVLPLVNAYSFGESFDSLFSKWQTATIPTNVAKIIFAVLLIFLIYALLENTQFIKNRGIIWIISILVSVLSTMYLAPDEIYGLLVSYSALGLTLGAIIPFLILFGFTYSAIKSGDPSQIILQWVAWIMFGVFMIYRSIIFWVFEKASGVSNTVVAILLGMTAVTLIMVLFNNGIRHAISRAYLGAELEAGGRRAHEAGQMISDLSEMQREIAERRKRGR